MPQAYAPAQPERTAMDAMPGTVALEFGTDWYGYCRAGAPLIAAAVAGFPGFTHIKVEDGPGRVLGRSYRVKLWPTLLVLQNGKEVARVVRPADVGAVQQALQAAITG